MRPFIVCATLLATFIGLGPDFASAFDRFRFRPGRSVSNWQYPTVQNSGYYSGYGQGYHPGFQQGGAFGQPQFGQPQFGQPQFGHPPVGYDPQEVEQLVRQWYLTYLGREPEPQAYQNWVNHVLAGTDIAEAQVGIMSSVEAFQRAGNHPHAYVHFLLRQVTGREPRGQEVEQWVSLFHNRYYGERSGFARDLLISYNRY
jgi:hypothetical protein